MGNAAPRVGATGYNRGVVRRLDSLVPHLPAALLLLFSGWAGTFHVGAEAHWALAGHLALLIFAGAFSGAWPDPLRAGGGGRLLLAALAVSVLASHLASPVTRAGRLGVLLVPAFVLVPSAVARCWASNAARRSGLRSVSLVVAAVASWSLVGWWRLATPGASLPLGHHGLLAAWLLATLPLAALPWRDGGVGRVIAAVAGAAGLVALAGTGSLAAALGAGVVAVAVAVHWRKGWLGLAALGLVAAVQLPRLGAVLGGTDASAAGRWSYLQAGWRGLIERPALGWGPGSARWTLAEHLHPVPGVHAPDQVVADVHSLPLQIAYELGWSGLLLVVGLVLAFLRRRPGEVVDPALRRVAFMGLAALAVMSLAGRTLAAPAVPLAAMIGLGAVLAAEAPARGRRQGVTVAVVAVLAALIVPLDLAHLAYDRAVGAGTRERQADHLRRAVALDPAFPLYRARLAWMEADGGQARDAARRARAVAPLWAVAGMLAQEAGEPWSREALVRACRLSPLGVIAPYRLTLEEVSETHARVQWTARALLAEPLVAAAVAWRDRGAVLRAAVGELGRLESLDPGWRAWLEGVVDVRDGRGRGGATRVLALAMDGDPATSVSLYAFRRRPWPIDLARIEIDGGILEIVDPGAAAPLSPAAGEVLQDELCGLAAP